MAVGSQMLLRRHAPRLETSPVQHAHLTRRSALAALAVPWLAAGCSTPLPLSAAAPRSTDPAAVALLQASAQAHGLATYRRLTDINVAYQGRWRPFVNGIQPEIVDAGFRGSSQERLLPQAGIAAQAYQGPEGDKQVLWRRARDATDAQGEISVWIDGVRNHDAARQRAATLVAEAYGLFLLGPLWLVERRLLLQLAEPATVDGRTCDVVDAWLAPGLGRSALDRVSLHLDRRDQLMRRVRFTLEGFPSTQGAVAEVDTFEHERRFGLLWPMRSYERIVHPIALPAHDWHIVGLDVNRGYPIEALQGPVFTGAAAAPAAAL